MSINEMLATRRARRRQVDAMIRRAENLHPQMAEMAGIAVVAGTPASAQLVAAATFAATIALIAEVIKEKPAVLAQDLADEVIVELFNAATVAFENFEKANPRG